METLAAIVVAAVVVTAVLVACLMVPVLIAVALSLLSTADSGPAGQLAKDHEGNQQVMSRQPDRYGAHEPAVVNQRGEVSVQGAEEFTEEVAR